jgi:hypothetical protein
MAQTQIIGKTCPINLALALRKRIYGQNSDLNILLHKTPPDICSELGLKCPPCLGPKGRAPLSCRHFVVAFMKIQQMERGETNDAVNELLTIHKDAEKRKDRVLFFESAVSLAKAHRTFDFDLFGSLNAAQTALKILNEVKTNPDFQNADAKEYVLEIEWSLKNQLCWALLYLRRPDEAKKVAKSCPALARSGIEPHIQNLQTLLAEFIIAFDGNRDFSKAKQLIIETGCRAEKEKFTGIYDQAKLYGGFCFCLDQKPEYDQAEEIFKTLSSKAGHPAARIYAKLGLAFCASKTGKTDGHVRARIKKYLYQCKNGWKDAHERTIEWRNRNYPWFTTMEAELEARADPQKLGELADRLRKRANPIITMYEKMHRLDHRIAFSPVVYELYRLRMKLFLEMGNLTQEQMQWLALCMERSRKSAIMPWYKPKAIDVDSASPEIPYTTGSDTCSRIDATKILLEYTAQDQRVLMVFMTKYPQPALVTFFQGKAAHYKDNGKNPAHRWFIRKLMSEVLTRKEESACDRIVLFADEDFYRTNSDLGSLNWSPERLVIFGENAMRFAAKLPLHQQSPTSIAAVVTDYQGSDSMETSNVLSVLGKKYGDALTIIQSRNFENAGRLLKSVSSYDAAIIFAHGELGTDYHDQKIRFKGFKLGIPDIYRTVSTLKNTSVCLCSCSTGGDQTGRRNEVFALGNVMVAAGARMVYCPLFDFDQKEFVERIEEFCAMLEGRPVRYPAGWRVIM